MTRRFLFAMLVLLGCLSGTAHAQDAPLDEAAERLRIQQARAQADARFLAQEKACYQRFAVTDCLTDARRAHREVLADLRRQDTQLNDLERKRAGAEALRRNEERLQQEAERNSEERRAQARQDQAARDARAAEKPADRAAAEQAAQQRSAAQPGREASAAQRRAEAAQRAAAAPEERARFEQRQKEAQDARERQQERQKNATKPPGKPLPVPP